MSIINLLLDEQLLTPILVRQHILNIDEETADIVSLNIVHEPQGDGLSVVQSDGHEYKYTADDQNEKYNTVEKLKDTAEKMLKYRSSGAVLGWLAHNALLYSGSKREAKQATEGVSQKAKDDLHSFLKTVYPEMDDNKIKKSVDSFIKKNNIQSDSDVYKTTKEKDIKK